MMGIAKISVACAAFVCFGIVGLVLYTGWSEANAALSWVAAIGSFIGGIGSATAAIVAVYIAHNTRRESIQNRRQAELQTARRALEVAKMAGHSSHLMWVYFTIRDPSGSVELRKAEIDSAIRALADIAASTITDACLKEVLALIAALRELKWSFNVVIKKDQSDVIKDQASETMNIAKDVVKILEREVESLERRALIEVRADE